MKKKTINLVVACVKIACIIAILAWLCRGAAKNDVFDELSRTTKRWDYLGISLTAVFVAVVLTFLRWMILVRALGLSMSLREAFRLGMIGFLFNLSPMGIAGGDAIRVYSLMKTTGQSGSKSLASVFIDRVIGLYIMFLIAFVMVFATGFNRNTDMTSFVATQVVIWCSVAGTLAVLVILLPDVSNGGIRTSISKLPKIGPLLGKWIGAVSLYRQQWAALVVSCVLTIGVHSLFCFGVYYLALGLFGVAPSMPNHFVIHPTANITSIIPLAVGPYEIALDKLYPLFQMSDGTFPKHGYGLVVALGFRINSIIIAALGLLFYLSSREEFRKNKTDTP